MLRQYIGARYVPIFDGDYNPEKVYEPLTIVQYANSSYTSKKTVPAGIVPTNTDYWALTGNMSGAIDTLTNRVNGLEDEIETVAKRYPRRKFYRPEDYGAVVNDETVDCAPAIRLAIIEANSNGGIVLLSEGIYFCQSEITISDHLESFTMIGTGRGDVGTDRTDTKGTTLWYLGNGTFIHLGGGAWECVFEDFNVKAFGSGSTAIRLSDSLGASGSRTTRTIFQRMLIEYASIGFHCSNAAYLDLDEIFIRGTNEITGVNKTGMLFDGHNEYTNVTRSRITNGIVSDLSGTFYNTAGVRLIQGSHFYFYNVDITYADKAYDIPSNGNDNVVMCDIDDCDCAYVHYGVYVSLTNTSLNGLHTRNFVYTGENSNDTRNRVFKIEKVSGGNAYGARMYCLDTIIRAGESTMDYWVEAAPSALYPGNFRFTFTTINVPKVNYGGETRVADFGTIGTTGAVSTNMNDYIYGGFAPCRFSASATNGPGFDCMLMCFASALSTIQIALPSAVSSTIAFRIYTKTDGSWSAWQRLQKTT